MAKATRTEISPAVPAVPAVTGVVLELTMFEAEVLFDITHRVGGNPSGPRGATDRIQSALRAWVRRPVLGITGGIQYAEDQW